MRPGRVLHQPLPLGLGASVCPLKLRLLLPLEPGPQVAADTQCPQTRSFACSRECAELRVPNIRTRRRKEGLLGPEGRGAGDPLQTRPRATTGGNREASASLCGEYEATEGAGGEREGGAC